MLLKISHNIGKKVLLQTDNNSIKISGEIKNENPGTYLLPFLNVIQTFIIKKSIKFVYFDISGLDYINPAGIRDITSWTLQIKNLPERHRYYVKLVTDPYKKWQEIFDMVFVDITNEESIAI